MASFSRRVVAGRDVPYFAGLLSGALAGVAALSVLFVVLVSAEQLPPPPLANRLCVDEKLTFLRDRPPQDPNFLVIGSSVAWRNFDSSVIAQAVPNARPINGAFCGTRVHHAAFAADWFVEQWPSINKVLLVSGPQDYKNCSDSAEFFNAQDAGDYVSSRSTKLSLYLEYNDPIALIRNVLQRREVRTNPRTKANEVGLTEYGDGPVEMQRQQGLSYGPISKLDPLCFETLRSLATELSKDGRQLMIVTTPLHPDWKARFDSGARIRNELRQGISEAVAGTNAEYWDADAAGVISSADDFADAVHIRWSAAGHFTKAILQEFDRD